MNRKSKRLTAVGAVAALGVLAAGLVAMPSAPKAADKYKIYLSMSYVGNDWQTESANMRQGDGGIGRASGQGHARSSRSPGPMPQRQIQQINAMVQAGAKAHRRLPDLADGAEPSREERLQQGRHRLCL